MVFRRAAGLGSELFEDICNHTGAKVKYGAIFLYSPQLPYNSTLFEIPLFN